MGVEEAEGGAVWHLVGLLEPEQDGVDEESTEEMVESDVVEGEADLEADRADSEPEVVELEDDDVELVDAELENHSGDFNPCVNQAGESRTLGVSIFGDQAIEYLKHLDGEAGVAMEGYTLS